eukprot:756136-Hanusia_phi.AAC.2
MACGSKIGAKMRMREKQRMDVLCERAQQKTGGLGCDRREAQWRIEEKRLGEERRMEEERRREKEKRAEESAGAAAT